MMTKPEIAALVKKSKENDEKAFERLYNEFKGKVYFFALRYVKNETAAEDLTSETFMTALEKLPQINDNESFVGWLYTICYNKCLRHIKAESKAEYIGEEEKYSLNEPVMLPDDHAQNDDTKRQLRELIDSLEPSQRSAVIHFYYENMSLKETASALGISENAAGQKLHRARKKLRHKIEKLFGSGDMLMAFPLSAVLENVSFEGFAAKGGAAAVKKSLAVKIAAIAVAGMAAVSAGALLFKIWGGENKPKADDLSIGFASVNVCNDGIVSSEGGIIHFTDFGSGQTAVLCSKPECKHNDESCYAYFDEPVFEDIYGGSLYVLDNGDSLNQSTLYKCSTDCTQRKAVAQLDTDGALGMTYVMKSGYLYCFTAKTDEVTDSMTFYPTLIDLESGEVRLGEGKDTGTLKLLYADSGEIYFSVLKTKADFDELMKNHTASKIDSYISDPENLEFDLYRFDGENEEKTEGFDSSFQAIYFDGECFIANDMRENKYFLTDGKGAVIKELASDPASVSLYMYSTVAFTDDTGYVSYYDSGSKELVRTDSKETPQYIFAGKAVFDAYGFISADRWKSGEYGRAEAPVPERLDDEYFTAHYPNKTVLHIYSDMTVCVKDNIAFNNRLMLLGKDYVVSFERIDDTETAGGYIDRLTQMNKDNAPADIFITPPLSESEDNKPYTECINRGLCEPLDEYLKGEGKALYDAYPEKNLKTVTRNGHIYGVNGAVYIGSGLCFDLKVQFEGSVPAEISRVSMLEDILLQNSGDRPAMYLDIILARHIKNQNGQLLGGCIPVRLENGELTAFDPYKTEFFKDYIEFVRRGKVKGFIGGDVMSPLVAGNRRPKEHGIQEILINGMSDYVTAAETDICCVCSWSEHKDMACDLLSTMAADELLNDILYYGEANIRHISGKYVLDIKDENCGAFGTIGSEYLLIDNRADADAYREYNNALPFVDLSGIDTVGYAKEFEKYREIISRYEAMLTGDDEHYKAHYKALLSELDKSGYGKTIAKINKELNKNNEAEHK